ncbi:MAG: hypothetical protein VR70_14490 [Rhodospirillaceae bacterium BRH_c57]|nr:MAG: hypothetical protein VR70_14490 [Rhodospirillaceae bacterium BRH_c57]
MTTYPPEFWPLYADTMRLGLDLARSAESLAEWIGQEAAMCRMLAVERPDLAEGLRARIRERREALRAEAA